MKPGRYRLRLRLLALFERQRVQYLDPNLIESALICLELICSSRNGSCTICPAPTTPSLLTSEAATGEVVLKQRRQLLLDILPNCRLADEIRDMFGVLKLHWMLKRALFAQQINRQSSLSTFRCQSDLRSELISSKPRQAC